MKNERQPQINSMETDLKTALSRRNATIPIQKRVVDDPRVKTALAAALSEQKVFVDVIESTRHLTAPGSTAAGLKAAIEGAKSAGEITQAKQALASQNIEADRAAKRAAIAIQRKSFMKFADKLNVLVELGLAVLSEIEAEAVSAETAFFSSFGIPREETSVSRRVSHARARITDMKASTALDRHWASISKARGEAVLAWFQG